MRTVERLSFPSPPQIVAPYHAQSAVLVRENEIVVVGSRGRGLRLDEPDAGFLELAAQAVGAITHGSPAKRLGDELELLHAVQDLAAVDTSRTVDEVLHAVGASAASSLSCEVAVVSVPGSPPVVVRRGGAVLGDWRPGARWACRAMVASSARRPSCTDSSSSTSLGSGGPTSYVAALIRCSLPGQLLSSSALPRSRTAASPQDAMACSSPGRAALVVVMPSHP